MFSKSFLMGLFVFGSAIAADRGIYVSLDIHSEDGDKAAIGKADYYYQNGNLLAEMDMEQGSVDRVTMLELDGTLYTLFPKEKKYMEVPPSMVEIAAELTKKETKGTFKPTGKKKKIGGHECEVYSKETASSTDTICLNQPLYKKYKEFFDKIQKITQNYNLMMGAEGFPLEVISTGKGKNKHKTNVLVKKIKEQDYKSKFVLPKNYQKQNVLDGAAEMFQKIRESNN